MKSLTIETLEIEVEFQQRFHAVRAYAGIVCVWLRQISNNVLNIYD